MSQIGIEGMEFYAAIGYYSQERLARGKFTIDVHIDVDTGLAARNDDLNSTINYEKVYDICAKLMQNEYDLIETVAHKVAHEIKSVWPDIKEVWVRVSKWNPPLPGAISRTFAEVRN